MSICQSCGMPLSNQEDYGTNADASRNGEYCVFCFSKGRFTNGFTLPQMIEHLAALAPKMGLSESKARAMALSTLPKLKRWKKG